MARTSLAAAGNLIQAPFMYDFADRSPFNEPIGREALGLGPFYHCYRATDRWFFFAAPTEQHATLAKIDDLADLADLPEESLAGALATRFKTQNFSYWQQAFKNHTHSSTVIPLASLHKTRDKALQYESAGNIDLSQATFRAIRHDQHPMGRWCDLVAPNAVRTQNSRITIPGPMPKYGQHTRLILSRPGYSAEQIDEMVLNGVAGENWSEKYLPE